MGGTIVYSLPTLSVASVIQMSFVTGLTEVQHRQISAVRFIYRHPEHSVFVASRCCLPGSIGRVWCVRRTVTRAIRLMLGRC